jgi:hypothetical protein
MGRVEGHVEKGTGFKKYCQCEESVKFVIWHFGARRIISKK